MKRFDLLLGVMLLFTAISVSRGGSLLTNPDGDNPPRGVITGKIAEENTLDPMEYTTIAIYSVVDSTLIGGTISDQNGNFELRKLPFGRYYIETDYVGYNRKVIEHILVTPDNRQVDLSIIEMAVNTQSIEEVEIVADRKHVEYRLDKKVINVSQDINSAGGTAVDVLENSPSVSVDIEGNVSLRGSSRFTVLIDGKPSVLTGSDALQQIPASAIENIEIITNPSAKYDPDGNAGIINVVMKRKIDIGTNGIVNASVGINNKYRTDILLNRKQGNWNFFIAGNYNNNLYAGNLIREQITYSDSLDSYLNADGVFNFKRSGAQLKGGISYDVTNRASISLEANGGTYGFMIDRSNSSHEYTLPAVDDIYYVSSSIIDRSGIFYSLNANYTQTFDSKDHKLVAMAFYSQRDGNSIDSQDDYNTGDDYIIEDVIPERTRALETSDKYEVRFQVDYTRPVGESGKLETGYQIRIDDEFEDYIFEDYDNSTEDWIENPVYSSELDYYRSIQSAYATYGGEWNGFQYQLGLRGEHTNRNIDHERSGETYLINRLDYYPTVHLAREFKNDHQLILSYSKRVDRPRGWHLDPNVSYVDPLYHQCW